MEKFIRNFHPACDCPVRNVLGRIGDKWSLLVLLSLYANGTMRFSDLHRSIEDISQRMLTVTLRMLESDGLVARRVYPEVPPRVEYTVTELGASLMPHINGIVDWVVENMPAINASRRG